MKNLFLDAENVHIDHERSNHPLVYENRIPQRKVLERRIAKGFEVNWGRSPLVLKELTYNERTYKVEVEYSSETTRCGWKPKRTEFKTLPFETFRPENIYAYRLWNLLHHRLTLIIYRSILEANEYDRQLGAKRFFLDRRKLNTPVDKYLIPGLFLCYVYEEFGPVLLRSLFTRIYEEAIYLSPTSQSLDHDEITLWNEASLIAQADLIDYFTQLHDRDIPAFVYRIYIPELDFNVYVYRVGKIQGDHKEQWRTPVEAVRAAICISETFCFDLKGRQLVVYELYDLATHSSLSQRLVSSLSEWFNVGGVSNGEDLVIVPYAKTKLVDSDQRLNAISRYELERIIWHEVTHMVKTTDNRYLVPPLEEGLATSMEFDLDTSRLLGFVGRRLFYLRNIRFSKVASIFGIPEADLRYIIQKTLDLKDLSEFISGFEALTA